MSTSSKKPATQLRDGNLKAAIWANEGTEKGTFYSVTFSRTFKDENGYHDANSYSGVELLKLARLATRAYDRIAELRADNLSDDGEAAQ